VSVAAESGAAARADLTFRCPPEVRDLIQAPVPAARGLPDWLSRMPKEAVAEDLGFSVRTVKQCPPFLDAMRTGVLIGLLCDIEVRDGEFHWSWDPPAMALDQVSRSPLSLHVPEQASGAPFHDPEATILKFNNLWTVSAPAGWSILVTHPVNRTDLPFRTLTGLVDADLYADAFIQFPALWTDPGFAGTLRAGTPVAQLIPVPRTTGTIRLETLDGAAETRFRAAQDRLQAEPGAYRKHWRARER
jgi:hypothetical protein